jgi:histidyl-tRNA synthetase
MALIHGEPSQVLPELRSLAQRHGLHDQPIAQIERILELLNAYGHAVNAVELNPGMGRGLHYYTGMLFEIYAPGRSGAQLAGGGRYDDLAQLLGSRLPLPACGFSYGLERVVDACPVLPEVDRVEAVVMAAEPEAVTQAIWFAENLRQEGHVVELDVRGRSIQANRRHAQRAGVVQLVIVRADGTAEVEQLNPPRDSLTGSPQPLASGAADV